MTDTESQAGPMQVSPGGWRDVLWRLREDITRDHVFLAAAGVAYYWLLAIFPAIVAAVGIWGLVMDPAQATALLDTIGEAMPAEGRQIVESQLTAVAGSASTSLGIGTAIGIGVALFSASAGIKGLMSALNLAYKEEEERGFLAYNLQALGLLLLGLLVAIVAAAGVVVAPAVLAAVGLDGAAGAIIQWGRWPVVALMLAGFLAVLYRYAPSREAPRWRWTSPGALVAVVLWLIGSALLSWYVSAIGTYDQTYGSLAGVVLLLLWFYLTAFVILLGAELNGELERQGGRGSDLPPEGAPREHELPPGAEPV